MSDIGGDELRLDIIDLDGVRLSYLPLAHIFKRVLLLYFSLIGAKYGVLGRRLHAQR